MVTLEAPFLHDLLTDFLLHDVYTLRVFQRMTRLRKSKKNPSRVPGSTFAVALFVPIAFSALQFPSLLDPALCTLRTLVSDPLVPQ